MLFGVHHSARPSASSVAVAMTRRRRCLPTAMPSSAPPCRGIFGAPSLRRRRRRQDAPCDDRRRGRATTTTLGARGVSSVLTTASDGGAGLLRLSAASRLDWYEGTGGATLHSSVRRRYRARPFASMGGGGGEGGEGGGGGSTVVAFDRDLKLLQRSGAAIAHRRWELRNSENHVAGSSSGSGDVDDDSVADDDSPADYDYFRNEIAARLVDRLDDIKRDEGFPLALDLGSGPGYLHRAICADEAFDGVGGIGGIRKLVQLDSSEEMLRRDDDVEVEGSERCGTYKLVANEEGRLPFPDGTFDLVMSCAALHWVNDLPRLLLEVKRVLKPDGCLLFAMVGGSTLPELRSSLVLAEMERDGGVSPHVGPFVDFTDVGSLLTAAGFTLPTVDIDTVTLAFPDAMVLMEHLQRMGEGNASLGRRERVGLDTFLSSATVYHELFGLDDEFEADDGGGDDSVKATIQVIYAIGWTPHESQPKPLERGSATKSMGDI